MTPLPSVSARLMEMAPADSKWSWLDDVQSAAAARVAPRHKRESCVRLEKKLAPLVIEVKKFPLSFNPPRFDAKGKEQKMLIRFLEVSAGSLVFRVMRKSDPGRISLRRAEVARRCGESAAAEFSRQAMEFVADAREEKPARPAPDWHTPATGVTVRQRRGACEVELGTVCLHNDKSAAGESLVTLDEAARAAAIVRKSTSPKRSRR